MFTGAQPAQLDEARHGKKEPWEFLKRDLNGPSAWGEGLTTLGGGAVQISLGFDEASVRADAGPLGELTCLWAGERVLQGAGVRALTSCSVL